MTRFAKLGFAIAGALSLAACATIVKGTNQVMTISSNVDGAEVFLDGLKVGTTPFAGPLHKGKSTLMLQKAGFQTANVALSKTIEPIFWGNIITGGTLGSLTDFATGAAYQYAPATYQVEMKAAGQSSKDFEEQVAIRGLSMIYIDDISRELAAGKGPYLDAILTLLNSGRAEPVTALDVREALSDSHGDPVRFGRRIVAMR